MDHYIWDPVGTAWGTMDDACAELSWVGLGWCFGIEEVRWLVACGLHLFLRKRTKVAIILLVFLEDGQV